MTAFADETPIFALLAGMAMAAVVPVRGLRRALGFTSRYALQVGM